VIRKLGGWKFPVYDLGGENWLGAETIRHTVEAAEGYVPMSALAQTVLSNFNGKIEAITETCFKAGMGADVFCTFTPFLLHAYFIHDPAAEEIIERGIAAIRKIVARVDEITQQKLDIVIHGSLLDIYKNKIDPKRIISYVPLTHNVELLAQLTKGYLQQKGIACP
jgi:glucosamine kinase